VELWGRVPPIDKLDSTLATLKNCKCVSCARYGVLPTSPCWSYVQHCPAPPRPLTFVLLQAPRAEHEQHKQDFKLGGPGQVRVPVL
jgi:hypothetical protein